MELKERVFKPYWLQFALPFVGFLFFATVGFLSLVYENLWLGLFLFLIAAPLLFVTIVIRSRRLIVGPGGIAQQSLFGREEIKWSEITDARYEIGRMESIEHHITLISGHRGRIMKLNPGFPMNDSIIEFIMTEVTRRKAGQILDEIRRGREVKYGKFLFTQEGLRYKGKEISWKGLKSVKLVVSGSEFLIDIYSDTYKKPVRVLIMEYFSRNTVCELLDRQLQVHGRPGIIVD